MYRYMKTLRSGSVWEKIMFYLDYRGTYLFCHTIVNPQLLDKLHANFEPWRRRNTPEYMRCVCNPCISD